MPRSNKPFTLEFKEGNWIKRVKVPNTATKFNPEKHIRDLEESDFLNDALKGVPYVTFKTDSTDEMNNLMQNGYTDNNVTWRSFFAYWKDQEGRAFLVPEGSGIKDLRQVGVQTSMKSPAEFMKVAKYANRLFAALPKEQAVIDMETGKVQFTGGAKWGEEVGWNEDFQISVITLDKEADSSDLTEEDRRLSIRYVDLKGLTEEQKALVDGCIVVSEKAAKRLGLAKEPRIGMAWRGTFGTQRGLGKGHILYKDDMVVDIVIYGPKTILKTDRFFFGSMGPLHAGNPHTDMQAYVNFGFHRPGLGYDLAKSFMREVMEASKNEPALRQLFLKHTKDTKPIDLDQEGWILRRAMAYGFSFLRFPGLYRRVVRYLMKKVMATDGDARIPMDSHSYSVAKYGYVLTDINAIDTEGGVHPENAIPEGTIVFPDLKPGTQVVCYRQPSENSNAWVKLTVTYKPEYKRFAGQGICLLGRGAHNVLGRLGGGDMDDSFVIVHDPKWVEAFHTLRPYPETEKIQPEITDEEQSLFDDQLKTDLSSFEDELMEDIRQAQTHYTNRHVAWQIELAKNARAGIGPVVNFGMMDLLLSDPEHTASMLADLSNAPEEADWLDDYRNWQYPSDDALPGTSLYGYHARKFMTNLELVIDGNVKDRTLLAKLGDVSGTIKAFHKDCRVYPACMSPWRVPERKLDEGDFKTARSLTCRSLENIRLLREHLEELFVEREWDIVTPASDDLDSLFPFEREIKARVRGIYRKDRDTGEWMRMDPDNRTILDIWGQEWREALSIPNNPEVKSGDTYKRIIRLITEELEGEDDDMMKRIAVQVYREVYKKFGTDPKLDEATGKMRNYQDGLLWSPVFGNHFINACREARVSGLYKAATIRPEFIGRLMDKSVVVQIRSGNVFIQDSEDEFTILVGFMEGLSWNGKFRMDSGLVEFRKPQDMLLPDQDRMVSPRPITRVFPSAKKPESETQEPKVPGAFGKLLNKALGALGMKTEDKK